MNPISRSFFHRRIGSPSLASVLCSPREAQGALSQIWRISETRNCKGSGEFSPTPLRSSSRGIANPETKEISSLSVELCEGESLVVTVFEIKSSEIPAFIQRELEFRFLAVVPETMEGKPYTNSAVLCGRYSDEEFFQIRCKGDKEVYFQHYGRYNIEKIWRDDILPCRLYLRHCVLAAKNLGEETYNNFLDHTFLGDRKTTIREYLSSSGSGIMEEEPPEALKSRYGG